MSQFKRDAGKLESTQQKKIKVVRYCLQEGIEGDGFVQSVEEEAKRSISLQLLGGQL